MYSAKELNLIVKGKRLLTRAEFLEFTDVVPGANPNLSWWLADADPMDPYYIAYAEGDDTEEDMYCEHSEANTFVRVALDVDTSNTELKPGDKFVYCGYVFTLLGDTLAVSDNFLGSAKYYDEEVLAYIYSDEEITCTLNVMLENLFAKAID